MTETVSAATDAMLKEGDARCERVGEYATRFFAHMVEGSSMGGLGAIETTNPEHAKHLIMALAIASVQVGQQADQFVVNLETAAAKAKAGEKK